MTPSGQDPPGLRRSRRAVRHAGTVGGDDADLVSTHPALTTAAEPPPSSREADTEDVQSSAPTRTPATARSAPDPAVARRSLDDSDVGWGERDAGSNDDRLTQDRPPHW